MEKTYNILIMDDSANVLWMNRNGDFVEDRLQSKIFLDQESKETANKLRETGDYIMVGRFPADLDWKDREGRVLYCPTKNKLESLLEKYLESENYEEACVIRDQLKNFE
jgi:hypothetical protein